VRVLVVGGNGSAIAGRLPYLHPDPRTERSCTCFGVLPPDHNCDADRTVASYSRKEPGVRPVAARNAFVK
jgi:hypothetical protein